MKEQGIVDSVRGDRAVVAFKRTSACQKCHACQVGDAQTMQIELKNTLNAKAGDIVTMELQSKKIFQASALVYVFPLVMLFLGILLGYAAAPALQWDREVSGALGALVLVAISYLILRLMDPLFQKRKGYMPKMCAVVRKKMEKE